MSDIVRPPRWSLTPKQFPGFQRADPAPLVYDPGEKDQFRLKFLQRIHRNDPVCISCFAFWVLFSLLPQIQALHGVKDMQMPDLLFGAENHHLDIVLMHAPAFFIQW